MPKNAVYEPILADLTYKQSTWMAHPRWTSDMFHGYIYPVQVLEMLPGDRFKADLRHFTRMSAPIAPVFGDFFQHVSVFFVPKRILFDKTKQFYGEAESFGIASEVLEPTTGSSVCIERSDNDINNWNSIASAFGLILDGHESQLPLKLTHINLLPVRGLFSIYNEYYRNENYQPKYMWNKGETGYLSGRYFGTRNGVNITGTSKLPQVNKMDDIFTRVLPYQLKSNDPVSVSVSGSIGISEDGPIVFGQKSSSTTWFPGNYGFTPAVPVDGNDEASFGNTPDLHVVSDLTHGGSSSYNFVPFLQNIGGSSAASPHFDEDSGVYTGVPLSYLNGLKAASALTTSLNDLIYALSYQYFLQRLAKGGSKYGEYIENIFGVKCPAAVRDEPEFLGHVSWRLNVDTIVQTTGHADGDTSELGQVGANSQTGGSGSLFNYAASEPGYLYVLTYTKHTRSYSTGINPIFLKEELLDYYQTPFANMPDVSLPMAHLWFTGVNTVDDLSLGFVEPFIDYKRFPDRAYGMMNPMNPGSSDFWTTGEMFSGQPVINDAFLVENRNTIKRVLTTGNAGPDYVCDIFLDLTLSRVMPLYSTGLGKM